MYDWDGINQAVFVGVQNYIEMFTDDRAFALSIRNSLYWTFLDHLPADDPRFHPGDYILTSGVPLQNAFRVIFFMPAIMCRRLCWASSGSGFTRPSAACWPISDWEIGARVS